MDYSSYSSSDNEIIWSDYLASQRKKNTIQNKKNDFNTPLKSSLIFPDPYEGKEGDAVFLTPKPLSPKNQKNGQFNNSNINTFNTFDSQNANIPTGLNPSMDDTYMVPKDNANNMGLMQSNDSTRKIEDVVPAPDKDNHIPPFYDRGPTIDVDSSSKNNPITVEDDHPNHEDHLNRDDHMNHDDSSYDSDLSSSSFEFNCISGGIPVDQLSKNYMGSLFTISRPIEIKPSTLDEIPQEPQFYIKIIYAFLSFFLSLCVVVLGFVMQFVFHSNLFIFKSIINFLPNSFWWIFTVFHHLNFLIYPFLSLYFNISTKRSAIDYLFNVLCMLLSFFSYCSCGWTQLIEYILLCIRICKILKDVKISSPSFTKGFIIPEIMFMLNIFSLFQCSINACIISYWNIPVLMLNQTNSNEFIYISDPQTGFYHFSINNFGFYSTQIIYALLIILITFIAFIITFKLLYFASVPFMLFIIALFCNYDNNILIPCIFLVLFIIYFFSLMVFDNNKLRFLIIGCHPTNFNSSNIQVPQLFFSSIFNSLFYTLLMIIIENVCNLFNLTPLTDVGPLSYIYLVIYFIPFVNMITMNFHFLLNIGALILIIVPYLQTLSGVGYYYYCILNYSLISLLFFISWLYGYPVTTFYIYLIIIPIISYVSVFWNSEFDYIVFLIMLVQILKIVIGLPIVSKEKYQIFTPCIVHPFGLLIILSNSIIILLEYAFHKDKTDKSESQYIALMTKVYSKVNLNLCFPCWCHDDGYKGNFPEDIFNKLNILI